jgi:hypothetical protein
MATRHIADSTAPPMCVVALLKRERARALVRAAFPRRRAHVHAAKSAADVEEYLIKELVDVVIIDAGAGDDAQRLIARAEEFPSLPFVLITTLLPADAPSWGVLLVAMACAATSASRARSRSSISIQANKWCERNTGWARWRCV